MKKTALFAALSLALPLFLAPLEAREKGKGLDAKIDIDIVKAKDVFQLFADLAGMSLELDPAVQNGPLTLRLENVRLGTALSTACDSLNCTWVVSPGNPARLRVYPGATQPAKFAVHNVATLDSALDINAVDIEQVGEAGAGRPGDDAVDDDGNAGFNAAREGWAADATDTGALARGNQVVLEHKAGRDL